MCYVGLVVFNFNWSNKTRSISSVPFKCHKKTEYRPKIWTEYDRILIDRPWTLKLIQTRCFYAEKILRFLLISKIFLIFWYDNGEAFYEVFGNSYS